MHAKKEKQITKKEKKLTNEKKEQGNKQKKRKTVPPMMISRLGSAPLASVGLLLSPFVNKSV